MWVSAHGALRRRGAGNVLVIHRSLVWSEIRIGDGGVRGMALGCCLLLLITFPPLHAVGHHKVLVHSLMVHWATARRIGLRESDGDRPALGPSNAQPRPSRFRSFVPSIRVTERSDGEVNGWPSPLLSFSPAQPVLLRPGGERHAGVSKENGPPARKKKRRRRKKSLLLLKSHHAIRRPWCGGGRVLRGDSGAARDGHVRTDRPVGILSSTYRHASAAPTSGTKVGRVPSCLLRVEIKLGLTRARIPIPGRQG